MWHGATSPRVAAPGSPRAGSTASPSLQTIAQLHTQAASPEPLQSRRSPRQYTGLLSPPQPCTPAAPRSFPSALAVVPGWSPSSLGSIAVTGPCSPLLTSAVTASPLPSKSLGEASRTPAAPRSQAAPSGVWTPRAPLTRMQSTGTTSTPSQRFATSVNVAPPAAIPATPSESSQYGAASALLLPLWAVTELDAGKLMVSCDSGALVSEWGAIENDEHNRLWNRLLPQESQAAGDGDSHCTDVEKRSCPGSHSLSCANEASTISCSPKNDTSTSSSSASLSQAATSQPDRKLVDNYVDALARRLVSGDASDFCEEPVLFCEKQRETLEECNAYDALYAAADCARQFRDSDCDMFGTRSSSWRLLRRSFSCTSDGSFVDGAPCRYRSASCLSEASASVEENMTVPATPGSAVIAHGTSPNRRRNSSSSRGMSPRSSFTQLICVPQPRRRSASRSWSPDGVSLGSHRSKSPPSGASGAAAASPRAKLGTLARSASGVEPSPITPCSHPSLSSSAPGPLMTPSSLQAQVDLHGAASLGALSESFNEVATTTVQQPCKLSMPDQSSSLPRRAETQTGSAHQVVDSIDAAGRQVERRSRLPIGASHVRGRGAAKQQRSSGTSGQRGTVAPVAAATVAAAPNHRVTAARKPCPERACRGQPRPGRDSVAKMINASPSTAPAAKFEGESVYSCVGSAKPCDEDPRIRAALSALPGRFQLVEPVAELCEGQSRRGVIYLF